VVGRRGLKRIFRYSVISLCLRKTIIMKHLNVLFIAALIVFGGAQISGAAEKISLNKNQTSVGFHVSYLIFARLNGHFDNFEGSFVIDGQAPENNRADITIQTASVDTDNKSRDANIRGPALFNAERYPTMVFHSRKIEMKTDNTGRVIGDLTLLGITKPVTLDFVKQAGVDHNLADGFKVTGKIKRSDFGMNAYIKPIGNTVMLLVCYNIAQSQCDDDDYQAPEMPRYNQ